MDFSPYQQLLGFLWYLIPLAILSGLIKSPWFKGSVGEFLVNASVRLFLDKSRYHQMHSVVVFVGDSTFKSSMPDNVARAHVRHVKGLRERAQ